MNPPVGLHLLPEHRQVVVTQHGRVQGVDALPRVGGGVGGLAVVFDGDAGKTVGRTSHREEAGTELRSVNVAQCGVSAGGCKQTAAFASCLSFRDRERSFEYIMERKWIIVCIGSFELAARDHVNS